MWGSRATSTKTRIETGKSWAELTIPEGSRATSTKTRIETRRVHRGCGVYPIVQEQHPLKQGLKHLVVVQGCGHGSPCSRATSTKTRIETCDVDGYNGEIMTGSRATSTKTRIETYHI